MGSENRSGGELGERSAFVFDVDSPRVVIGDEVLLEGLRRYAAAHGGRPFRMKDFRSWKDRPFEPNTVRRRFGTWREALRRIGVEGARVSKYDAADLMENLEDVWRRHGRRPSFSHLQRMGRCGWQPYCRRWGSVRGACARLAAFHRGEMTREEMLRPEDGRTKGRRRRGPLGRKAISVDARWRVLKRDRFRCRACGKSPATHEGVELEVDHIKAVARGGGDEESNLRALCRDCNRGKRDGE